MAVYRVQRTRDYTVMSNYHLRDKNLTLKSKGLLSMILSLPDEWNYTTRGLAAICKEGVDAIGSALKELETAAASRREWPYYRYGVHHLRAAPPQGGQHTRYACTGYGFTRYGKPGYGSLGYGYAISGNARRIKY